MCSCASTSEADATPAAVARSSCIRSWLCSRAASARLTRSARDRRLRWWCRSISRSRRPTTTAAAVAATSAAEDSPSASATGPASSAPPTTPTEPPSSRAVARLQRSSAGTRADSRATAPPTARAVAARASSAAPASPGASATVRGCRTRTAVAATAARMPTASGSRAGNGVVSAATAQPAAARTTSRSTTVVVGSGSARFRRPRDVTDAAAPYPEEHQPGAHPGQPGAAVEAPGDVRRAADRGHHDGDGQAEGHQHRAVVGGEARLQQDEGEHGEARHGRAQQPGKPARARRWRGGLDDVVAGSRALRQRHRVVRRQGRGQPRQPLGGRHRVQTSQLSQFVAP